MAFDATKRYLLGTVGLMSPSMGGRLLTTSNPLVEKRLQYDLAQLSETLIVFLPGIQDLHLKFFSFGFHDSLQEQKISADIVCVDAHLGYYVQQTMIARLHQDIILPAKQMGYKNIWLAGTSLGGLGVALYAEQFESEVSGIFLMAPYLGSKSVLKQVETKIESDQLRSPVDSETFELRLWQWLKKYFDDPSRNPKLYLGFGDRDKFAYGNSLLAEGLSKDQVLRTQGSHDWPTWKRLWGMLVEKKVLGPT